MECDLVSFVLFVDGLRMFIVRSRCWKNEMEDLSHMMKENCVWDFVLLNPLTEEILVKTLCLRFKKDQIYVRKFSLIQYEIFLWNYSLWTIADIQRQRVDISESLQKSEYLYHGCSPELFARGSISTATSYVSTSSSFHPYCVRWRMFIHPVFNRFAVVATAYRWLNDTNEDQCIVLSGESGSGKTEILKRMLDFLSFILHADSIASYTSKIIYANIVLEGIAETNDNSLYI